MNKKGIFRTGIYLITVILVILSLDYQTALVEGPSMMNTYRPGDYLLIKRYKAQSPSRGDVVIARVQIDVNKKIVKRVIAIPGDDFEIRNNQTYINGMLVQESYLKNNDHGDDFKVTLKANEFLLLGDNREESLDSRYFGVVHKENLIGKVVFLIW